MDSRHKICLILFSLILSIGAQAQSDLGFAPVGAKWHYNIPALFIFDPVTYVSYEVTGDTVINGKNASIVKRWGGDVSNLPSPFFLHYDSNRVYWHNQYSNDFHLLFDFNANAGDSWSVKLPCDPGYSNIYTDTIQYNVVSTDSIIVNGVTLKRLIVNTLFSPNMELIERIGLLDKGYPYSFFYCGYGIVDPSPELMRCYEDSLLGLFKGPNPDVCDTTYVLLSLDNDPNNNLKVYPNPATNILKIESSQKIDVVQLQSLAGEILIKKETENNYLDLNTSNIPIGLHFISVTFQNGSKSIAKVMIKR